jgi:ribosomal protein L31
MKTLENFLQAHPSYTKWGTERIAQKTGLSVRTVKRFKSSQTFKAIKSNYLQNI